MSSVKCVGGLGKEAMNCSTSMSRRAKKHFGPMAFSNRDSVGWLARSSAWIDRPQSSLKIGSLRKTSWSFWSA
jgi:hypothetical protein